MTALLDAEEIKPKSRSGSTSRSRSRSRGRGSASETERQSDGFETGEVTEGDDDEYSTPSAQKKKKSNLKKDFTTPKKKLKWDKSVPENIHFEFGGTLGKPFFHHWWSSFYSLCT